MNFRLRPARACVAPGIVPSRILERVRARRPPPRPASSASRSAQRAPGRRDFPRHGAKVDTFACNAALTQDNCRRVTTTQEKRETSMTTHATAHAMSLTSPDIKPGARIPDEHTFNGWGCAGQNISPALSWSGAPRGHEELRTHPLRSRRADGQRLLALGDVQHSRRRRPPAKGRGRSQEPQGAQGRGAEPHRFRRPRLRGPLPAQGRQATPLYFTIFAVDVDKLDADEHSTAAVVGFNLNFHTLAKAELTGVFGH